MSLQSFCPKVILLLLGSSLAAVPAASQCSPELDRLLAAIQKEDTSNGAMKELVKVGDHAEARKCLSDRLPRVLEAYKARTDGIADFVWGNEARVARELRITEAVPVLARRIDMATTPGMGGSLGYNFFSYEAVGALIQIGAPAVPSVTEVLKHGSPLQREMAAHVLRYIGTDEAWSALEEAVTTERDRKVLNRIQEALNSRMR